MPSKEYEERKELLSLAGKKNMSIFNFCVKMSVITLFFILTPAALAEPVKIFDGRPVMQTAYNGEGSNTALVKDSAARDLHCIISQDGEKFFWTSRENKLLKKVAAGAYVTFMAEDGSGYVRIANPEFAHLLTALDLPGNKFGYVEHLLNGLGAITYHGILAE